MENRSVNPPLKAPLPRPTPTEPINDKKVTKTNPPTTTTKTNPTVKVANVTKPFVNAPVKPMSSKGTSSPLDDRLSDEECNIYCR